MTIKEVQEQIIEDFSMFDEWLDKYEYIIELANELKPYDDKDKVKANLISGCQSRVWIDAGMKEGIVTFKADSDAIITKGIVSLLVKVLSGRSPEEIMNADLFFIEHIGLRENLSPTRANGLVSMIKRMKTYGLAYFAKSK